MALGTSTPTSITVVGHQDADFAALEFLHRGFFFVGLQLAVQQANCEVGEDDFGKMLVHLLRGLHGLGFRLFDDRINHVGLTARLDLLLQEAVDLLDAVLVHVLGDDRLCGPEASRR